MRGAFPSAHVTRHVPEVSLGLPYRRLLNGSLFCLLLNRRLPAPLQESDSFR